jgi:MFS family permease
LSQSLARRLPFFYGWVVVAVAFVTMGIGVNSRTAFSLLYPPILTEFRWDHGVTAGAFSFGFIAGTVLTPFIGAMMDRFGPRWVVPTGAVTVAAGLSLATLSSEPWHLYATLGFLVVGGSILMSYIGHSMFLPMWFVRRRGLAIGIAFSGVGVGSIVLFPLVQDLIDGAGWRQACLMLAILLVVVLVPLNFLLQRQRPEQLGLEPDGDGGRDADGNVRPPLDTVVDREWAATDWTLGKAVRTGRFWLVMLGYFGGLYAWYGVQVHQTQYLIAIGIPSGTAALALGLVGFSAILGQIWIGHLSDRIGREWAWTISGLGFVACYGLLLAMQAWPAVWLVYLMVAVQGLLGYGLATVYGAIPAEIFQGRSFGTIFGTISFGAGAGAAAGPWATGRILDATGSYEIGFALSIAVCLVSIGAIWLAAPRKVRAVAGRVRATGGSA